MENLMHGQLLTPDKKQWVDVVADREGNQLVSSLRAAWRDDFNGTELNPDLWEVVRNDPGQSIALTGVGELTIDAGTTADEVTIIRSRVPLSIPVRVWFLAALSQRIINQEIYLELVNASGDMAARWMLDGTTASNGKFQATNGGNGVLSVAKTITTSATQAILEIEMFPDEVWFASRELDFTAGKTQSYCRQSNVPDTGDTYYIQIRVVNLTTAPASATTLTIGAVAVQDINELTAEITGGRGDDKGAKAIAVNLTTSSFSISPNSTVGTASTNGTRVSLATVNANFIKAGAGVIGTLFASNTSASWRWLKFFNKTSAPTVGTDTPALTIGIPPGQTVVYNNPMPLRFFTGIAYAITANPADNDATAIGAGDVVMSLSYT